MLARFQRPLLPELVTEIESWADHPQLNKLRAALYAHTDEHTFLNAVAEAMVARYLLNLDCELDFEVPTPSGKQADFQVTRDGERFYLHIKRLDTSQPAQRTLTVSSRLRVLERIKRPYIVSVRWKDNASDEQMQRLVTEAEPFIMQASVGDVFVVRDEETGREIGAVRIVAPWEGPRVTLTIGINGFIDDAPRMRRLLQRAYLQFMPRATNVILMCSSNTDDGTDFENALLGTHIERWDAFPPRGQRIAHGRAEDGFWYNRSNDMSHYAGWFQFCPESAEFQPLLWLRNSERISRRSEALVRDLFPEHAQQLTNGYHARHD